MPARADTVDDDAVLHKIGFGSCSNQRKGPLRPVYEQLSKQNFDLWIWGGDAVYAKGVGLEDLRLAFEQLSKEGSYEKFASKVGRVVGTWDDHDLGKSECFRRHSSSVTNKYNEIQGSTMAENTRLT
jgi:phosphodiesterase/alkaline phosphatase D-like protein